MYVALILLSINLNSCMMVTDISGTYEETRSGMYYLITVNDDNTFTFKYCNATGLHETDGLWHWFKYGRTIHIESCSHDINSFNISYQTEPCEVEHQVSIKLDSIVNTVNYKWYIVDRGKPIPISYKDTLIRIERNTELVSLVGMFNGNNNYPAKCDCIIYPNGIVSSTVFLVEQGKSYTIRPHGLLAYKTYDYFTTDRILKLKRNQIIIHRDLKLRKLPVDETKNSK